MKKLLLILVLLSFSFSSLATNEKIEPVLISANTQYDDLLGEIKLFPYTFAPRGWMKCEGQLLAISEYQALFALLGIQYGGDGRTTFALPNLKSPLTSDGKEGKQLGYYCICVTGVFPSRS